MKRLVLIPLIIIGMYTAAQTEVSLYGSSPIPNNTNASDEEKSEISNGILRISKIKNPTLTIYLPNPEKANGTAVIICPGGGYGIVAASHEGHDVAKRLNEEGIAAFVLKYRMPDKRNQPDPSIAPLQDAQQAILTVRKRANEWGISPDKIGIMGFSAGGHLASTAGTHFERKLITNPENISLRPDFLLLIYPVITADVAITHKGSYKNLLGDNPSVTQLTLYSNDKQVTAKTPPTFLVHATDDGGVHVENSIRFYQALKNYNIPAAMHLYQGGGHGFGMNNPTTNDNWMDSLILWLKENKW